MTRFFYLILLISYYINFFYLWLLASILVNLTILCTIRNSCKMSTESFGLFYNFFYFMYVFFNEIYFYVSKSCQIYHITGYVFLRASNYVGDKKINPIKMCLIFLYGHQFRYCKILNMLNVHCIMVHLREIILKS